jgi:general secretion pathway protein B
MPAASNEPPPSDAQLRASGIDVPTLDLQLHSFSDSGAGRFVFINGARYGEGETLAAGPRVIRITPNGVVLDQRGREFLLTVD